MKDAYQDLAIAIIAQAAKDTQAPKYKEDAEEFLKSDWCSTLMGLLETNLDGQDILRRIKQWTTQNNLSTT